MSLDWQTALVVVALVAAATHVGSSILVSLRPKPGCSSCRHNATRSDDYA